MKKIFSIVYAGLSYIIFLGTFLYAIGFVGNVAVPKGIDSPAMTSFPTALILDLSLLLLFALQHSVMARSVFKQWFTTVVPAHLERTTYVLASSICLAMLMWGWQPLGGVVWHVRLPGVDTILLTLCFVGWTIVLCSTFLLNHFDLFGLRQVWYYVQGRRYEPLPFRTPALYKMVRHPLYLGFVIAFWSTPLMTVTHLLFAVMTTGYILVATWLEEKDLQTYFGPKYHEYQRNVPRLIPFTKLKRVKKPQMDDNPWNVRF